MQTHTQQRLTWLQYCKQELNKAVIKQKEEGFTLIELLLVIGIIAILAAIVILAINPTANIQSAQNTASTKQARAIQNAIVQHVIDHGAAPDGIGGTPMVLCAPGFEVVDGCEINLEDEIANQTDSEYSFISDIPVAANRDALGLPDYDSGFRVSFDGSRYTVVPTSTISSLVASTFELTFGGTSYESATDMKPTSDGGYIMVGAAYSSDGDISSGNNGANDYWLVKVDSSGTIEWEQSYGGSNSDYPSSVQQTTDGGYIIVGSTSSNDGDISSNNGQSDVWLVKTDSSGALQWEQSYGGTYVDSGLDIQQTADGGYIIAAHTSSYDGDVVSRTVATDGSYWIIKINSTGVIEWEDVYGGSGINYAYSIQVTSDGGYIVTGQTTSNDGDVSTSYGSNDVWTIKLSSTGILEWEQSYGGSSVDYASHIISTSDGGYVIAANSTSTDGDVSGNNGNYDYWIIKTNSTGTIEWEQNYGGTSLDETRFIQQTSDGGYIVGGETYSTDGQITENNGATDIWLIKISSTGVLEWQQNYGGSATSFATFRGERLASVFQTSDGGYIIFGDTPSTDFDVSANNGFDDFWLLKVDSLGEL